MKLRRLRQPLALVALFLALSFAALLACGPDFPNMLLTQGDRAVLTAPTAIFARELERMRLTASRYHYHAPPETGDASTAAEVADLREALKNRGVDKTKIALISEDHLAARVKLANGFSNIELNPDLPSEFADYFRASTCWHEAGEAADPGARQASLRKASELWRSLLGRPSEERRSKSTWAEYMLGVTERLLTNGSWERAIEHFQKVRSLVDEGFLDSLGLAAASLGLEAQVQLGQTNLVRAAELYLDQYSTGDPTAVESLRIVAARALQPENSQELRKLAEHPRGREVITAHLVSGQSYQSENSAEDDTPVQRWLELLDQAQVRDLALAEKLALAAYQNGHIDAAERWLNRCSGEGFAARWLRAKLLFYSGKIDEATETLAALVKAFPPNQTNAPATFGEELVFSSTSQTSPRQQVSGELGVLRLARGEFTQALDALLRGGFWIDAAYVAERVLTLPELVSYVDAHWPANADAAEFEPSGEGSATDPEVLRRDLRFLLGRRLARVQQDAQALPYLPSPWKAQLNELIQLRVRSLDRQAPARARARALFDAAKITREHGLELFGTETGPDWQVYGGNFTEGTTFEARQQIEPGETLHPGTEELGRARQHGPLPDRRFHYRYVAADLAMQASEFLPDNDSETAVILCTAGSWLKDRDPEAADRFYKTLVRRCRKTAIGKEADKIRWFPRIDGNGNILPRPVPQPPAPAPPPPELLEQFPLAKTRAKSLRIA